MLALGSVHEVIEGQIEEGKVDFDIKGFLENVVLNDAANPGMYIIFHIVFCWLIALKTFLENDLKRSDNFCLIFKNHRNRSFCREDGTNSEKIRDTGYPF